MVRDRRIPLFWCLNRQRMRKVKGERGQTVQVPAITFPFIIRHAEEWEKKKTNEERNNIESSFFFVQKTGGPHLAPRVAGLSLLIWGLEKNSTNCCMKEDIGAACGFRAALLTSHEMLGSWSADLVTRHHHLSSLCVH